MPGAVPKKAPPAFPRIAIRRESAEFQRRLRRTSVANSLAYQPRYPRDALVLDPAPNEPTRAAVIFVTIRELHLNACCSPMACETLPLLSSSLQLKCRRATPTARAGRVHTPLDSISIWEESLSPRRPEGCCGPHEVVIESSDASMPYVAQLHRFPRHNRNRDNRAAQAGKKYG